MPNIIGRKQEQQILQELYQRNRSEFIALYGRRRVGKTYLIKELFSKAYTFQLTGLSKGNTKQQLQNFHASLLRFDPSKQDDAIPTSWFSAFQLLIHYLENVTTNRKVVFIDELPWLDTPRSDFMTALEHFWNAWAFHRNDIFLVVCGSATSWMINELINNHGGLHNRVTKRIYLKPFTLKETEAFLTAKGSVFGRYEIVQLFMAIGGIPFYLEEVNVRESIAQNIDRLFFSEYGILRTEFQNLYASLFKKQERHIAIVEALAKKAKGLSRGDLAKAAKLSQGGRFTKVLKELEQCGFIQKYLPFGKKKKGSLYQLTDQYSLFYLKFVKNSKSSGAGAWLSMIDHPAWRAWSGYAFERICIYHLAQIKKHLGIEVVHTEVSAWKSSSSEQAAQIDLVIDRRDRIIHLCEIKFSENPFPITKAYAAQLRQKISAFKQESKTNKSIFLTFITTYGLVQNQYARQLVQQELKMDFLFE